MSDNKEVIQVFSYDRALFGLRDCEDHLVGLFLEIPASNNGFDVMTTLTELISHVGRPHFVEEEFQRLETPWRASQAA